MFVCAWMYTRTSITNKSKYTNLACICTALILSSLSNEFTKAIRSSAANFKLTAVGRAETK